MKNKECIIVNFTGRTGAGPLNAIEMAKAFVKIGECVIPIISSGVENITMWHNAGFEKLVIIDTYDSKLSLIINSLKFPFLNNKKIKKSLLGYKVKMIYCPMVTFWTKKINRLIKKTPIIMVNHDPIPHSGQSMFEAARIFNPFKQANIVIVHSKEFVDYAEKKYNHVEYLPLNRHDMYKNISDKKKIVWYDSAKINFFFFGRIEKYKGLDILARAYKKLNDKYKDKTSLTIVGNGDLSDYAAEYDGIKNVTIINRWIRDEEVESVFTGNNLVNVCPYKDATQSGVVLVAYEYGVPVIATDTGGLREQVFDNKTGFLISPNSVDQLVLAMEKYIHNNELIKLQQENIKEYLKSISWESSAKKLVSMLNS